MYFDQDDIDTRYPGALEQAGPRNADGDLDGDAIDAAIVWAESQANTYLGPRYGVPLARPAPAWLKDRLVDMALYRLTPSVVLDTFADRRTRSDAAIAFLQAIHDGKLDPPTTPAAALSPDAPTPPAQVVFELGRRDFADEDY